MKGIVNSFIANVHFVIFAYGLYCVYGMYEEHSLRMEELNNQFPEVEQNIVKAEKKMKDIKEFERKAEESKIRVEEVAKNIEAVQKQLPSDISDNQILTFFNQEMSTLNIKDPNITPGKEEPGTYFISKGYSLKARGTFLQFLVFFERIGSASRIYNVKKLSLVNSEPNQRGRFQMISSDSLIDAYRFNPDFKVDRGFETPAPPAP
jgi:hypothetical protein